MSDDIAAFLGAVVAIYCAVRAVIALPADILGSLIPVAAVIGGAVVLLWVAKLRGGHVSAGRARHVHGVTRRDAAVHEAGHAAVGRHIGARVGEAWISDNGSGGITVQDDRKSVTEQIAVDLGGGMREGRSWGSWACGGDRALTEARLRRVPRAEHGRVMRDARSIARAGLSRCSGYAARVERRLMRDGRM